MDQVREIGAEKSVIPRTGISETTVGAAVVLVLVFAATPAMASDGDPPDVGFDDRDTWLPVVNFVGFEASAQACDESAVVSVSVAIEGVGIDEEQGHASCLEVAETVTLQAPRTYDASAEARDDHGNEAEDDGRIVSRLVPFDTDSVPGYPPLDQVEATDLGSQVTIDTHNGETGVVKGYEVTSDGDVLLTNMAEVVPEEGDFTTRLVVDRPVGGATLDVDGWEVWSGLVYQSSTEWWHFKSIGDLVPGTQ